MGKDKESVICRENKALTLVVLCSVCYNVAMRFEIDIEGGKVKKSIVYHGDEVSPHDLDLAARCFSGLMDSLIYKEPFNLQAHLLNSSGINLIPINR